MSCLRRGQGQQKLTLELGVCSPSDSKHVFRDFRLEDDYPYRTTVDLERDFDAYRSRAFLLDKLYDPLHGWVNGQQSTPSPGSVRRLIGTWSLEFDFTRTQYLHWQLPEVAIVTGLLIRRQYHQTIDPTVLSVLFRECFTHLEWYRYKQWHDPDIGV